MHISNLLLDRDLYREVSLSPQLHLTYYTSKILWQSTDVFNAVARKEGKKKLRQYQAAYNPQLARRFIEDELAVRLGKNVAQLFYEHDRVDLGENLGIR